ncbi:hypothetical protein HN385_01025 [archaeon]|jgi:hypothetical protein|nr:hypothetical protein [archaeon]MBT3450609.1 hypothetical protein [archaeon]MBT6868705.1 hypothetical protein [archaeon]MBT7193493.1 hypothetical protein [archaeon]MBT7381084.1 hypothetical protein [archaeon]
MSQFRKYSTIDEIMSGPGKKRVIDTLNSNHTYLAVVKFLGYSKIGIKVLDNTGNSDLYISDNRIETGEIVDIYQNPEDNRTDVTAVVKEQTLMNMLYKMDWIQDHTLCAALKYFPRFRFEKGMCTTILRTIKDVTNN